MKTEHLDETRSYQQHEAVLTTTKYRPGDDDTEETRTRRRFGCSVVLFVVAAVVLIVDISYMQGACAKCYQQRCETTCVSVIVIFVAFATLVAVACWVMGFFCAKLIVEHNSHNGCWLAMT